MQARNAAAATEPRSLTWAAYQCYGDPGYRIEVKRGSPDVASTTVSESELDRQIEISIARAGDIGRTRGYTADEERAAQVEILQAMLAEAEADDTMDGRRPKLRLTAFAQARAASAFSELGESVSKSYERPPRHRQRPAA